MKTTLSFLAIVAISIGCVFSSCQSKVNNPSHNELDSTKTSVEEVDSAAIIAQQKQKEAEKAAEAEKVQKQKEEFDFLLKFSLLSEPFYLLVQYCLDFADSEFLYFLAKWLF